MTIGEGYAQVTFVFSGYGPFGAVCTLGLENATSKTAQQIADTVAEAVDLDGLMSHSASTGRMDEVRVKLGPDETGATAVAVVNEDGGDTSPGASSAVAFLIRKVTHSGGRKNRGRMYWPGITEPAVDAAGHVSGPTAVAVTEDFESFRSRLEAADLNCVILHAGEDIPTLISEFVCDGTVATQRRRQRR